MRPERLEAIKKQALASIGARARNPKAPGVAMVAITPHEALEFCQLVDDQSSKNEDSPTDAPSAPDAL